MFEVKLKNNFGEMPGREKRTLKVCNNITTAWQPFRYGEVSFSEDNIPGLEYVKIEPDISGGPIGHNWIINITLPVLVDYDFYSKGNVVLRETTRSISEISGEKVIDLKLKFFAGAPSWCLVIKKSALLKKLLKKKGADYDILQTTNVDMGDD